MSMNRRTAIKSAAVAAVSSPFVAMGSQPIIGTTAASPPFSVRDMIPAIRQVIREEMAYCLPAGVVPWPDDNTHAHMIMLLPAVSECSHTNDWVKHDRISVCINMFHREWIRSGRLVYTYGILAGYQTPGSDYVNAIRADLRIALSGRAHLLLASHHSDITSQVQKPYCVFYHTHAPFWSGISKPLPNSQWRRWYSDDELAVTPEIAVWDRVDDRFLNHVTAVHKDVILASTTIPVRFPHEDRQIAYQRREDAHASVYKIAERRLAKMKAV